MTAPLLLDGVDTTSGPTLARDFIADRRPDMGRSGSPATRNQRDGVPGPDRPGLVNDTPSEDPSSNLAGVPPALPSGAAPDPTAGGASSPEPRLKRRIVLADDHPIFLEGLKRLLVTEFDVVGTASNGQGLVELVQQAQPDLVVTDYSMPGLTGVEAVKVLKDAGATCKVVMLTMHEDVEYALEALDLGIDGYVLKRAASSELISAIMGALEGERWISPALAVDIISATAGLAGGIRPLKRPEPKPAPIEAISARQRHILQGLIQGKIAKEIGKELGISRKTVEYHKYKMMDDLGVKSSAELIQLAVRSGVAT